MIITTVTGRMYSSQPNMQSIKVISRKSIELRNKLVPKILITADYDNVERVITILSAKL